MSDRIAELGKQILDEFAIVDVDPAVFARVGALTTELATIAREAEARAAEWIDRCYQSEERALKAEAMCEWLAGELYDEDYLGLYTRAARTSENEPYTPSDRVVDIATIVATARAAVEQEEAE